jgi:hypothetical protein
MECAAITDPVITGPAVPVLAPMDRQEKRRQSSRIQPPLIQPSLIQPSLIWSSLIRSVLAAVDDAHRHAMFYT